MREVQMGEDCRRFWPRGAGAWVTLALILWCGACGSAVAADRLEVEAAFAVWPAQAMVDAVQVEFICQKTVTKLDTPLISRGTILAKGPDLVRISTSAPYVSDLLFQHKKVLQKSQHESDWTSSGQPGKPGLTGVFEQIGLWLLGDGPTKAITPAWVKWYHLAAVEPLKVPQPNWPADAAATPIELPEKNMALVLTPANSELAKSVKQITLTMDATTHRLFYMILITSHDDTVQFWFNQRQENAALPHDAFQPGK